jgi:hypothetical protein
VKLPPNGIAGAHGATIYVPADAASAIRTDMNQFWRDYINGPIATETREKAFRDIFLKHLSITVHDLEAPRLPWETKEADTHRAVLELAAADKVLTAALKAG